MKYHAYVIVLPEVVSTGLCEEQNEPNFLAEAKEAGAEVILLAKFEASTKEEERSAHVTIFGFSAGCEQKNMPKRLLPVPIEWIVEPGEGPGKAHPVVLKALQKMLEVGSPPGELPS